MPGRIKEDPYSELRKQAERAVSGEEPPPSDLSPLDMQKLILELRVHQAELEIQNEELMRLQADVEESRSRYADLYDFAPVGYFTFDRVGLILDVNLTGAALIGIERRFLIRKPFVAFLDSEYSDAFRVHRNQVLKSGVKEICDLKIQPKRRDPLFVRMESIVASKFGDGKGKRIRSVLSDIDELVKTREALVQARGLLERRVKERTAELEEANREMEAFTYSVSHDLRSPIRAIEGFARMIEKESGGDLEKDLLRKFKVIRDNALKMGRLIDSLLDLSRLGRKELRFEPIDMNQAVSDVLKEIRGTITSDRLKIDVQPLPEIYGDRTLVRQVLYNLLSNAVKFTHKRKEPRIQIGGERDRHSITYYVRDNGTGFNMAYYDKLFGVFQRLHGAEYEGTGIGLAIVRRIVERHGGKVWAEAAENKGATFYFSLPLPRAEKQAIK